MVSAHIFTDGKMGSFPELQAKFGLPQSMYFPYLQLRHAVRTQARGAPCIQSPAPVFHYMAKVSHSKGFITRSYSMLMAIIQSNFPTKVITRWEGDGGIFEEEEVLRTIQQCSLNTAQCLSQLFIVLWVHFTPARLHKMGIREDADCP